MRRSLHAFFLYFFRVPRSRLTDFEVRREVASSRLRRLRIRSAFLELVTAAADAAEPAGEGEVVSRPAARIPHPTRAGDQDDGSYTNSLK